MQFKNLTKEQAIELYNTNFWKQMPKEDIATFQIFTSKLCMPFEVFHEALEFALDRPVWTHELGIAVDSIQKELLQDKPAPSFDDIMSLIPKEVYFRNA